MNERGLKVLEQYDFKVTGTRRGRGAFICETDQGLKLVTEFAGSGNRLNFQNKVLKNLKEQGYERVDAFVENAEGNLISVERDGMAYIVKDWFDGKECDTKNEGDVLAAIRNLAHLHRKIRMVESDPEHAYTGIAMGEEYARKNREIKKVRKFIRARQQKNEFERVYLESFSLFYEQAEEVANSLKAAVFEEMQSRCVEEGMICHGDYNQHHILNTRYGIATTNFNKCRYDIQCGDLYQFMRKILEKHSWNPTLGMAMLDEYSRVEHLGAERLEYLKIRLAYPEKFWKLANQYYNHNKAWIPGKSVEKMEALINQQKKRDAFLKILDL